MRSRWRLQVESEDFLHLDALRVIATLCVVIFHWHAWLALDPGLRRIFDLFGSWAPLVDLFFVISGIIICHVYATRITSLATFGSFLRKRLARLAPLHWATLAFCVASGLIAPLLGHALTNPEAYALDCIAPNIVLLQSYATCDSLSFNYPSWSISAEAGCYLLFPALLALYRVSVWLPGAFAALMIAVLSLAGPFGPNETYWYDFDYYWGLLRGLPAFAIGITLYGIRKHLAFPHAGVALYAGLAIFLLLGQFGVQQGYAVAFAYALGAVAVAADSNGRSGRFTRALAPWGALTYPAYMLHIPVGATLISVGAKSVLDLPPLALNIAVWASIPILVGVAYLSYVLFETPARRWLSGRSKPQTTKRKPSQVESPLTAQDGMARKQASD